jgi:hypothetical protein
MNPRIVDVRAEEKYHIRIWFTNGEVRVFDVSPYLETGLFSELKEEYMFRTVKPFMGSIQWKNGLDLCPDTLYEESLPDNLQVKV